ncbi:MAG: monofunctional biosynthetic peptidoglycan transglycosylase [Acidobacteria bacterium]|nr:MAG: monofunctional biosynthetic peptidoglycan transglycosylase [Acidobacteriota bacterium]MCE7957539.1 monofunctional biosynthetic peptidoglycan transglycosylase [Acidobacteria bacterium ACB2]
MPDAARRRTVRRGLALAALAVLLWGLGVFVPLPAILLLRFRPPRTTAFIEARKARLAAEGKPPAVDRRPVPLEKVSPHLIRAVIAAEDARFFEHHGVDWDAVKEAREHNRRQAGRRRPRIRGASTITQQLAKNLFLSPERSLLRKGREAAIAMTMDLVLPKSVVLEHYLSAIEWGERVYGCEAAARATFGVPASRLSPSQAATLAAMIPNPVWYRRHPDRLSKRAARIALRVARERPSLEPLEDEDDEEAAFFAR